MTGPMPFAQLDDRARRMLPLVLAGPYVLLGALVLFTAGIKHAAWGSLVPGASLNPDPLAQQFPPEQGGQDLTFTSGPNGSLTADVTLPRTATDQDILGGQAKIRLQVRAR